MARIQHIAPTPVEKTELAKAQALDWDFGETQWALQDAFEDAEYPEVDGDDERVYYTLAYKIGRKRNITARADVLAVTRDLEYAIEMKLPATIDDATLDVELVNYDDGIPAAFARPVKEESTVPEYRHEQYTNVLERAHDVDVDLRGEQQ
ncbi:hypothetical protein [Natrinema hispanicum]|uniref:Uncharacterized protein n=1 Tax=Natrinema hispanicum TaxID=392421 RepID=A0A1I0IXF1_9EURY|nr:hypothetical protein [Natrinema hispanicum]SEU01350.1 hypothetical protein SAMN04488694_12650 [Natrinema hispanicum]